MDNIWTLDHALTTADKAGCALGSFALCLAPMIQPLLLGGKKGSKDFCTTTQDVGPLKPSGGSNRPAFA
jgi:hypothetical protein